MRSIRMVGTAVLAAVILSGVAAAQEPATVDVFAGGGLATVQEEGGGAGLHAGGGVWATEHLRVGALVRGSALFGLLSVHLRIPVGSDTSLLIGATPIWYADGDFVGYPRVEALLSKGIASRLQVEAGVTFNYHYLLGLGGGPIQALGRVVYSFD